MNRLHSSLMLPWLRLFRLPNVFTALADVAMGYLFVRGPQTDAAELGCVAAASACLYTAGMVLNDVFDFRIDLQERPFRPLPAGQISLSTARVVGFALLMAGVALGWAAGYVGAEPAEWPWHSGAVAIGLAACVLAYNGLLKQTFLGPLAMGACRSLNVLLGMSAARLASDTASLHFSAGELLAALGIGVYIVGVTWFARSEAEDSRMGVLIASMAVMAAGVALLGYGASQVPTPALRDPRYYGVLLGLLVATVLRRCATAAFDPRPQHVQLAVKHSILSLIWFDAATVWYTAGPTPAVAIAALLLPALLLGRWVYST